MPYIVVKKGVYMQEIHGLYGRVRDAAEAAQQLALLDKDNYHDWEVHVLAGQHWRETGWDYNKRAHLGNLRAAHRENERFDECRTTK